jgi:hypothetical protein
MAVARGQKVTEQDSFRLALELPLPRQQARQEGRQDRESSHTQVEKCGGLEAPFF